MARALKISLSVVLILVLLLAVSLFAATRLIDPNDFKPEIAELARKQASLDLRIPGQLEWSFWPSLGVTIGRTEARLADEEALFAAIDNAHVSVAVWPLLFGEVNMDGVRLDGMNLNLVRTAEGANWEQIGPADGTAPAQQKTARAPAGEEDTVTMPVSVPEVTVTNGRVSYRDSTTDTDILVEHLNLNAQDVSLEAPFPVSLSLRYQDQADIRVDLDLNTVADLHPDRNIYRLNNMALNAEVGGLTTNPVTVSVQQTLEANLDDEVLAVRDLVIRAAGTRTHGKLDVSQWSDKLLVAGELHTDPFDANDALKSAGLTPIETSDPVALSRVSVDAFLNGPPNSVIVDPLIVKVDNSEIRGSAGLANLDTGKLLANLTLDDIVLDGYLPPAAETAQQETATATAGGGAGPALSEEPLLPLETLRSLLVDARLSVKSMQYQTINAANMEFAAQVRNGVVTLDKAVGRALDGSFDMQAKLDASGDQPAWSFNSSVKKMQIQPAVELTLEKDLLKGLLSLDAELSANGNSEKALMESAAGNAELNLADGTLRGVNFHNTLVGGLNDMLGAYQTLTAFLPAKDSGKLPRELSEDTHIVDLQAKTRLEKRVAYVDQLTAELRKGTLTGDGWLNIANQEFDFTLGMKSPEFSDNKYFAGRTWPIRCEGDLGGSPSDWCRPDRDGFRQMGKDIAAQAAREKVKEKLGIEAEGDTAKEVMKNAAEEKAKEEVKRKVEEKLRDLFN